jgi:hypothetical protein
MSERSKKYLEEWRKKYGHPKKSDQKTSSADQSSLPITGKQGELLDIEATRLSEPDKMRKKGALFLKLFEREWNKRFQLVNEDGTPLALPKEKQDEDDLSEEELSEEDLQYEMELAEKIGDFLDELIEKEEVPPAPKKQLDL